METTDYFYKIWKNYKKENIINDFDRVMKKVKKSKVPN
jgi:hypothetical protein